MTHEKIKIWEISIQSPLNWFIISKLLDKSFQFINIHVISSNLYDSLFLNNFLSFGFNAFICVRFIPKERLYCLKRQRFRYYNINVEGENVQKREMTMCHESSQSQVPETNHLLSFTLFIMIERFLCVFSFTYLFFLLPRQPILGVSGNAPSIKLGRA